MNPNLQKKLLDRQFRTLAQTLNSDSSTKRIESNFYVEGYATRWEPYLLFEFEDGPVYEKFSREAFKDTDISDVILQFDHTGRVFARQSNGSLIVEPDSEGLFTAMDLSRSNGAKDLYEDISAGLITKMSWAFLPGEVEFDKSSRTIIHRSIKKIYDVSAVSIPANDNTTINARTFADGVISKWFRESEEREKERIRLLTLLSFER